MKHGGSRNLDLGNDVVLLARPLVRIGVFQGLLVDVNEISIEILASTQSSDRNGVLTELAVSLSRTTDKIGGVFISF